MQRLTTIDDLQGQWQGLLPTIEMLGVWFDNIIRDETNDVKFTVFIPGEKTREPGVHASEVSGCMKKFVYALMGTERKVLPEQVDINMKRRFGFGHALHALTQDQLTRAVMRYGNGYVEFIDEVAITPQTNAFTHQYTVYSHSDGLFTFYNDQFVPYLRVILEIKTESKDEYDKLKSPKPMHVEQAHVYMRALDVPITWFLYYNKSNSDWTPAKAPWLVTYDKKVEAQLENRIQSGYQLAHQRSLPQAEEGIACGWCPFAHDCKPAYLLRKAGRMARQGPPRRTGTPRFR